MNKMLRTICAGGLAALLLAGCSGSPSAQERTPEELTELYASAITENGGEMVEYNPVISQVSQEDPMGAMVLETLGLSQEDMDAFGVSMSMMNVQAYTIAAVMPAQGREEAVQDSLQTYVEGQQASFEMYLPDQKEVADSARLETLEDGTVLLVMCQDQDAVFEAIRTAVEG